MGNDIFGYNRQAKAGQLYDSEDSVLSISPGGTVFLGQSFQINYQQQIQEIFEIGTKNIYWVGGRPSGTGEISRLMGPASNMREAMAGMQICNGGATIEASLGNPCTESTKQMVKCSGVVLQGKAYALDVGKIVVAETLQLKIAKVEES